ncbi:RNA-directed DNA polymerase [Mannheimia pernigra]|uniref:RNA-directed DNA polymerase n=1 Tax=Mannheimia pernigra TaxID=111844 RepID=UPI00159F4410|nr:RNA-directed DNA polymerase [Mannheimia pernigra]QLB44876.1 RNA-directed DNA polymerase [Mannheimia pernigra]
MSSRKSVLELSYNEARSFFLKHESYCNIDLPKYFSFSNLLEKISQEFIGKDLVNDFCQSKSAMGKQDGVNHLIYANKDGKLSWRPLQIIHPLVYVALVHEITKEDNWGKLKARFKKFQSNEKIKCLSIPVQSENKQSDKAQQISSWWEQVEQRSILIALEYDYIFDTDVADCYGSVYTHAIAWAVESKQIAKKERSNHSLLGNFIDKTIQNTQGQQTNGIPQGSVLMDFIAEIILGYIDRILSVTLKKQEIKNYKILRYRDDYRIFVCNPNDGEKILKCLSEIMMLFGFKLNASKTKGSQDVITQSIKKDKLAWLAVPQNHRISLQKQILLIRQHSISFPNSGSLNTALNKFDKKLEKTSVIHNLEQLVSIVTDIAYHNPKVIPVCCAIISKLLNKLDNHRPMAKLVHQKLSRMPNSGFTQIWLQRMLKADLNTYLFSEKMCDLKKASLWNNEWVKGRRMLDVLNNTLIFQQYEFDKLDGVILNKEIDIFNY